MASRCPHCHEWFSNEFSRKRHASTRHFQEDAEEEEDFPTSLRNVAEHALDLHYLAHAKPEICQNIVRHSDNSLIHCLAECCENVLYGHVDLTKNQKLRLVPYRECMREVAKNSVPLKRKKEVLQVGGFLPALLGPLVGSVILPLAQKVLGSL